MRFHRGGFVSSYLFPAPVSNKTAFPLSQGGPFLLIAIERRITPLSCRGCERSERVRGTVKQDPG
jgi:hypothetical protein